MEGFTAQRLSAQVVLLLTLWWDMFESGVGGRAKKLNSEHIISDIDILSARVGIAYSFFFGE